MRANISRLLILVFLIISLFCVRAEARDKRGDIDGRIRQITFVELGSKRCIPCKMMEPVMKSIEKGYAGKVKVVFYDVWTEEGEPYGQKYGIQAIPTQVFFDKDGNEFYRHTGFLAENLIVDLLEKQGVTKE
ncbi:MAG: thioredoxin family protein [Candidatus Omnitrophota bacterium]